MRNVFIILSFLLFTSCGTETEKQYNCGIKGQNCPTEESKRNSDTDTTTVVYVPIPGPAGKDGSNGKDGIDGNAGRDGSDGTDCSILAVSNGALVTCGSNTVAILNGTNGTNGVDGSNGRDGINGTDGTNGSNGSDGRDGTNGTNGTDGQNATQSAYSVVSAIDPCGTVSGFNEILLRLGNGQIIAHYSQGGKEFLSFIGPGSYVTTDFTPCYFTIHTDMSVTW